MVNPINGIIKQPWRIFIEDFAMYVLVSSLSEINPSIITEVMPKATDEAALNAANSFYYSAKFLRKKIGRKVLIIVLPLCLKKLAITHT